MSLRINRLIHKYATPCMWASGVCSLLALIVRQFRPETAAVLFSLGALLTGLPILHRAIQGLRFKTVGIECLVSIACVGAFCIGELSEAAIVTFLFQFGSWLEQKTMKKTRSAIKALTEMAPSTACRIRGTDMEQIDADEVEEGDLLLIRTGDQIAVDGTVVWGEGHVNEASVTGESLPHHKHIGDTLYAGTFLDSGTLRMEATKVGENTTFAKIIALVEEAQDAKSPAERFIDKFAKYYTPAVVILAALVFLILRNPDTAITVLVLACPGALVIGAPIANVAGIGRGAQEGILLKGGDSVHTFVKTDTMVFDKTGTLTAGRPEVIRQISFCPNPEEALALAASAEQAAQHPLARALVRYAGNRQLALFPPESVEIIKGMGLKALVEGHTVLVGNPRLLEENNISLPELPARNDTPVLIAVDGNAAMVLSVADGVKPDAAACMKQLKKLGIRLVMLTGDNAAAARAVGNALGMDEIHAGLLPQEKLAFLKKMQSEGRTVTFVGDGINDSPALTAADTGIAMGNGTDIAIDSSDVVLIKSDLGSAVTALMLARKTVSIMYQNIAIAIGTVVFLLAGLFAGYIHMAIGMLVHEASILIVIFNAMRLIIFTGGKNS